MTTTSPGRPEMVQSGPEATRGMVFDGERSLVSPGLSALAPPTGRSGHPSRVVVLAGGLSHERDVSLRSGRRVAEALRDGGFEVDERDVDATLLPRLSDDPPDCVVPLLHGESGEDGAVRELLDLVGMAYVGSRPAACPVGLDK